MLRADPRNLIFPSVLCGGLLAVVWWKSAAAGISAGTWKASFVILALYAGLATLMMAHRLAVTADEIIITSYFRTRRIDTARIVTSQLSISRVQPLALSLYDRAPNDHARPFEIILLKPFRRADIAWLLDQPRLRLDP